MIAGCWRREKEERFLLRLSILSTFSLFSLPLYLSTQAKTHSSPSSLSPFSPRLLLKLFPFVSGGLRSIQNEQREGGREGRNGRSGGPSRSDVGFGRCEPKGGRRRRRKRPDFPNGFCFLLPSPDFCYKTRASSSSPSSVLFLFHRLLACLCNWVIKLPSFLPPADGSMASSGKGRDRVEEGEKERVASFHSLPPSKHPQVCSSVLLPLW